ncbi:glycosyltransferase [Paenibacillus prosopidis]|uniref:Glycosyltransferase involved in cell wall biosynthesis n=1 Tax=Paenibacillus prosopidis TaxID=630520 RepID=A0A368W3X6_9BACL|nr:glycosyltransferase [Paenibacillus prosopidis]RCW49533.1 glycosyltransferase involved in cell wall biosynthesis [Paenibacillus prosopidis]
MIGPILYLPCFDFHPHRQRPQHLLYQLSLLGFDVIYCNVTQNKEQPFVRLNDRFVICQDIEAIPRQRYIMWVSHGPYLDELHRFDRSMLITDIADASVGPFSVFAPWHERKIKEADLVLCASQPLFEEAKSLSEYAMLVRNGAETECFTPASNKNGPPLHKEQEAAFLAGSTAPVIGFWGAVADWLDFELIGYLAEIRPYYLFVFIGTISCTIPDALTRLPNIRWLGDQEYEALPAFARQFDAAIIPFIKNDLTEHANPIKMYEYLAAGLPVVSTDLAEIRPYSDVVRVVPAGDKAAFERQLDEALLSDRSDAHIASRQQTASSESWKQRAHVVAETIRKRSFIER